MRTRERRPTVYVMDATGNTSAASFRHRLAAALRAAGSNAGVKLTRPHNAAAVEREIERTRRHFAAQFPDGYELPEDFSHFTTSAEAALHAALRGDEESAFAIVAVVGAAFVKEQRQREDIQYPARFFLRNERPDALIPVLIDGPAPSRRGRDLGMRLLAAVPAEDWREGPTNEKFSSLATRLVQVLDVPFPADRRTTPRAPRKRS